MHTHIPKSLVLSLLALAINQAHAQTKSDSDDVYVMVTTAIHQHSAETALPVTLLSGDLLHKQARATLGDTLAMQPGISNASFDPAVGQTVIRGQQGRRVMNLTNSIPNGDASGNSADHAQTVEPLLATSIEVLRGPATLLYGGGAIGGVVNVLDRRIATHLPQQPEFALETRYDSASALHNTVASTDFATDMLAWHFDGVQRDWKDQSIPDVAVDPKWLAAQTTGTGQAVPLFNNPKGVLSNTGGSTSTATGGVSWIFDSGHLGFAVSHLDNAYGLPATVHLDATAAGQPQWQVEDNVSINMKSTRYDVNGQWHELSDWLEKVDYSLNHTDYQHVEMEGALPGTRFSNNSWQQRLQMTMYQWHGWHSVVGLQESHEIFSAIGEESFIPLSMINSGGVFVVGDYHTDKLTFELGTRLNRDAYRPELAATPKRDFTTSSFSGSVLWQASDPLTVGLSLARSERAPSVEELYSNHGLLAVQDCVIHHASGACEIGNDSFRHESSLNTDLTFAWERDAFKTTLTLFDNHFSDYIAEIADGTQVQGFPVRRYTQEDARFRGAELDFKWKLSELYSVRLYGDTIRGYLLNHGDAPRLPPFHWGVDVNFQNSQWSAHATFQHALGQQRAGSFELASDPWSKLEFGVDYTMDIGNHHELLLFMTARNVLNETIRLSTSYLRSVAPEAGRSLESGIRIKF